MKVGVVRGGQSAERAVSLVTGREVAAALRARGHEVVELELDDALPEALRAAAVEVVFPAVHGGIGENGVLQGCLELMGVPYVGSGVLGSALAMNKSVAKVLFTTAGLRCAQGLVVDRATGLDAGERAVRAALGPAPYMVKPNAEGSALGATRVFDDKELRPALEHALAVSPAALVEQFVTGREMTVAVLEIDGGPRALPPIEILSKKDWYDYDARYTVGLSDHVCPPEVSPGTLERLGDAGVRAHQALHCRDYSRMDCLLTDADEIVVLEVNSLPGMTPTSLFPDAARAAGYDFQTVVDHLVRQAAARRGA